MRLFGCCCLVATASGFFFPAGGGGAKSVLAATDAAFEEALRRMTNDQLRAHLKRRGEKTSGNKTVLIERARATHVPPPHVDRPPPAPLEEDNPSERKVLDGLLRDTVRVGGTRAYAASTKSAWRTGKSGSDRAPCGIVVVAPGASDRALRAFSDSVAFVCDAVVLATTSPRLSGGAAWLRNERKLESLGLVLYGDAQVDEDEQEEWDALILWRTPNDIASEAALPVLSLCDTTSAAIEADNKLRANDRCDEYMVRAFSTNSESEGGGGGGDLPTQEDDDAFLLATAWFDLYLGKRSAKTAGPQRASHLWIDD